MSIVSIEIHTTVLQVVSTGPDQEGSNDQGGIIEHYRSISNPNTHWTALSMVFDVFCCWHGTASDLYAWISSGREDKQIVVPFHIPGEDVGSEWSSIYTVSRNEDSRELARTPASVD